MTTVVEGLLTIVKGLKPKERREFLSELLRGGILSEDEQDLLLIESRRGGPTRPFHQFVGEMKRKGRLR
jgi:hypothetical protein